MDNNFELRFNLKVSLKINTTYVNSYRQCSNWEKINVGAST